MRLRLICRMFPAAIVLGPTATAPPAEYAKLFRKFVPVMFGATSGDATSLHKPPPLKANGLLFFPAVVAKVALLLLSTDVVSTIPVPVLIPPPAPAAVFDMIVRPLNMVCGVPEPEGRPVRKMPPPSSTPSPPPGSLGLTVTDARLPEMVVFVADRETGG